MLSLVGAILDAFEARKVRRESWDRHARSLPPSLDGTKLAQNDLRRSLFCACPLLSTGLETTSSLPRGGAAR